MKKYSIYLRKSRADLDAEALGEMETLARHRNDHPTSTCDVNIDTD